MAEEIQYVLLALTDLSVQNEDGVSVTYLVEHLGIQSQRLQRIIENLSRAEYIDVASHGHVQLVTLTQPGREKAVQWRKEIRERAWFRQIPTPLKVVAASLFAAVLGLLWWWLGLSPDTSELLPLGTQTPIKMYDMGTTPAVLQVYWSRCASAPASDQMLAIQPDEDQQAFVERRESFFEDRMAVTFDGWVRFRFDFENVAPKSQVNIDSVLIQSERKPPKDPEDLYYVLPAGEGKIHQYEVSLDARALDSHGEVLTSTAILRSDGKAVDYIYLQPGERESIEIDVQLGVPGVYTLTPAINYAFRDESSILRAEPYHIAYPRRYRVWTAMFYDEIPDWFPGKVHAPRNDLTIVTLNTIVDTQSGKVQVPTISRPGSNCSPPSRWIAFESGMITYPFEGRAFVIEAYGSNLKVLPGKELNEKRSLEWIDEGNLLVGELVFDDELQDRRLEMRSFDPTSGEYTIVPTDTLADPNWAYEDVWDDGRLRKVCLRDGSGCFVTEPGEDTTGDGEIDDRDVSQIYFNRNDDFVRVGAGTEEQYYLSLSHDETMLAFVQGTPITSSSMPTNSEAIYVMHVDGNGLKTVVDRFGCYRNPVWSPDGRSLAFAAARPANVGRPFDCDSSIYHIFVVDLVTGNETQLTDGEFSDQEPHWSADGQWVLAGGERLTLSRADGSCTQDVFVPPIGKITNVLLEP